MAGTNHVSIFHFDEYRKYLRAVLDEKTRRNPSFSLRAFARAAKVSASHLSRTLNGESKLSATSARQIALALNSSAEEADHFLGLIELEQAADDVDRRRILKRLSRNQPSRAKVLSIEHFRLIAEWYHFAILNLPNLRGFRSDISWVAKRLGIRPIEARLAVERLLMLGLMHKTPKGLKAAEEVDLQTTDDISSAAIQENHTQHLNLAQNALREVPIELREFNNLTLSMNLADVSRAKKALRDFIDKFNRDHESVPGQELFQLNVQFYLLSKSERGKS